MNITTILAALADDKLFKAALILIVLDLVLGVIAAAKSSDQQFVLTYVSNFLRNDLLGKVVPWAALYIAAKAAPDVDIAGISLDTVANGAWVFIAAALGGSILSSLKDLGFSQLPNQIAGKRE